MHCHFRLGLEAPGNSGERFCVASGKGPVAGDYVDAAAVTEQPVDGAGEQSVSQAVPPRVGGFRGRVDPCANHHVEVTVDQLLDELRPRLRRSSVSSPSAKR